MARRELWNSAIISVFIFTYILAFPFQGIQGITLSKMLVLTHTLKYI